MSAARRVLALVLLACGAGAWGQSERVDPHLAYLYPAGGRQNSTVRVTLGGQNLRGVTDVRISGAGVRAQVLEHFPPLRNIEAEQREALVRTLRDLMLRRWAELKGGGSDDPLPPALRELRRGAAETEPSPTTAPTELPRHPLLYDLEHKSLRELVHVRHMLAELRKGPPNNQLAESVLIEVTIDRDAEPGERELRLLGRFGLTNPMVFEVGALREVCELELEESRLAEFLPAEPPLELPVVLNGQILSGDVDRFRFKAAAGQGLVVETHARRLIPFLADAVPGWFQATVSVYDAEGKEVAFGDDYRFDPDPVLYYQVPADGEYELEIRDAIYRGRQDFVYRVTLGEQPFIRALFPLGTRAGHKRYVEIEGWNLTTKRLLLDPGGEGEVIRQRRLGLGKRASNRVTFAVDDLPTLPEAEDNDTPADAQRVALPRIVDGRIDVPGDVDMFQFAGRAGCEVVAEITARRLNSPLDSLVRLLDAYGNVLAWNDDYEHKDGFLHLEMGLLTHSADSYVRAALPADGVYFVQVADAQGQGGPAHGYRLRISPPQPDFALRVTPASVNISGTGSAPLCVYALRKDGFEGDIDVVLEDAPPGFRLDGATLPAGRDRIRMTLSAPPLKVEEPVVLRLVGRARIGTQTVARPVTPAEDVMQAFLYRHLVPAQELMVTARGRRLPAVGMAAVGGTPVHIPPGGSAEVQVRMPPRLLERGLELRLSEPPAGVTLAEVQPGPGRVQLVLRADLEAAQPGTTDNLIVEAFMELPRGPREPSQGPRRVSAGCLPAIPIVIDDPQQAAAPRRP